MIERQGILPILFLGKDNAFLTSYQATLLWSEEIRKMIQYIKLINLCFIGKKKLQFLKICILWVLVYWWKYFIYFKYFWMELRVFTWVLLSKLGWIWMNILRQGCIYSWRFHLNFLLAFNGCDHICIMSTSAIIFSHQQIWGVTAVTCS